MTFLSASSVNNDLVLHFLLFIPSVEHQPLHVLEPQGLRLFIYRIMITAELTSPPLGDRSSTNAFLIPQWGGIVVYNPLAPNDDQMKDANVLRINQYLNESTLAPSFALFRSQLYSLLGVPTLPSWVNHISPNGILSEWQVDSLLRSRAIETTQGASETLGSIVKLIHQIRNMPVKKDVRGDMIGALDALDEVRISPWQDLFSS